MPKNENKHQKAARLSSLLEGASPEEIFNWAVAGFTPRRVFVGFSGGFDSLVATHWAMNNIPGCEVFHAVTGIGVKRTLQYVVDMCDHYEWPLNLIRAKEDCGQDYDQMVIEHGFPGPGQHSKMFRRLKERPVRLLLKRAKQHVNDQVMLVTGIRQDESARRANYQDRILKFDGNLLWASLFYYRSRQWFADYIAAHKLPRNPVSEVLGMSGECLCGAFAHPGEKALIKLVCPETHARIEALEVKVKAAGHAWGWEERPPKRASKPSAKLHPFCVGCEK